MPYVRIGKRKVLTRRKRCRSAPAILITDPAPKRTKQKQWDERQMDAAMKAVQSGKSSINRAAEDHGIPRSTLKNRVSGKVEGNSNPGPVQYLTNDEERELGVFIKDCASIGYGKTRKEVMRIAETHVKRKGVLRKDKITQGWWRNFVSRQGDLSLRKGDNIAHVRMDAINSETINHYFDLLESTLKENGLMCAPSQIYVDESRMPLDPKAPNIVAETGTKKVHYRSTGRKGQITIVACGSTAGQILPPTIIFEAKKVNSAWSSGELPGTTYGCSDKGWITTDLFESWLSDHFLEHAVSARPLLLLLDGHSTHNQPEVVRFVKEKKVIILCLPPHAMHEAQPLDCGVFSPLKAQWRSVAHDFLQSNPGMVITKFNFNSLFANAWLNAVTPANVIAGFKTCGVYPFNCSAIKVPESKKDASTSVKSNTGGNTETTGDGIAEEDAARSEVVKPKPFTAEQETLFKRRFEEGYDVYIDKDYIRWINLNHPEFHVEQDLTPTTPDDHLSTHVIVPCEESVPGHSVSSIETSPQGAVAVNKPVSVIPAGAGPSTSSLSDLLVCPAMSTYNAPKRTATRARLLTSDESLRLLEEKEKRKEMELLEKENRKKERAAKKKEREELMQKKKEKKAKKAEEKAKRAEENSQRLKEQSEVRRKAPHFSQLLNHAPRYIQRQQLDYQLKLPGHQLILLVPTRTETTVKV